MEQKMESESDFLTRLREAAQWWAARLFRNNNGVARYVDERGKRHTVRYGLGPGTSDLIGWQTIDITEEMVGQRVAVFVAVEGKRGADRLSQDQRDFLAAVSAAGGIAIEARSPGDVGDGLDSYRRRLTAASRSGS